MIKGILQTILLFVSLLVLAVIYETSVFLGLDFASTIGMVGVWIMAALFLLPIAFGMFDYKVK